MKRPRSNFDRNLVGGDPAGERLLAEPLVHDTPAAALVNGPRAGFAPRADEVRAVLIDRLAHELIGRCQRIDHELTWSPAPPPRPEAHHFTWLPRSTLKLMIAPAAPMTS